MYCRKCGWKIPDDSIFCPYCGVRSVQQEVDNEPKPNKPSGFCSSCGKPLPAGQLIGLCKDCKEREYVSDSSEANIKYTSPTEIKSYSQHVSNSLDSFQPSSPKHHSIIVFILIAVIVISIIMSFNILGSGEEKSSTKQTSKTSTSASSIISSIASEPPLSVRQQQILDVFERAIKSDVEDSIEEYLKNPETAIFEHDKDKLTADNAIFTCYGNVYYTNASGENAKEAFEVSIIATKKNHYYPLYVEFGGTVFQDCRKADRFHSLLPFISKIV